MFVAVAMDAGGVPACKPLYDGAKAAYVTLVDPQNALGDALGFKVVPNGFFIDEAGVIVGRRIGGFEVKSARTIKSVEEFLARPPVPSSGKVPVPDPARERLALEARLRADPNDAAARLGLGRALLREGKAELALSHLEAASKGLPESSGAQFALGSCRVALGRKEAAAADFRRALALDRENYLIRKQIWLLEHPERFHPEIDWAWQREQLARERKAEGAPPPL